jgi:hypothetical protein
MLDMWLFNRNLQALGVLAAAFSLPGCVSRDPYPDYWPALTAAPKSVCADIAGRYRTEAIQTGQQCHADPYKAQWDCDLRLSWALGQPAIAADESWVEILQPDSDRIEVVTATETRVLRRSAGDFDCDEQGIEVSQYAGALSKTADSKGSNAYMGTMSLLVATGGVNSLTLHFRRAADGSLVARLSESTTGLVFAIPFHRSEAHYLRWAKWSDEAPGREAPAAEAPAAEPPPEGPPPP